MPRQSAGLVLYRSRTDRLEIFLIHMGGPFWAGRDAGAWSIPKGEFGPDEDPLAAARREFREETGFESPDGPCLPLTAVRQAGGKIVLAWAVAGDCDPARIQSNTVAIEWPPHSGQWRHYPEADRAAWFTLAEAKERIISGQAALLDELQRRVAGQAAA